MAIPSFTQAEQPECVEVAGSWDTTTSTTVPSSLRGVGFTVAKPQAGEYTLTFDNPYYELISFFVTYQKPLATIDLIATMGTYTAATGSTGAIVQVHTHDGATPALADYGTPGANSRIHFIAKFRRLSGI